MAEQTGWHPWERAAESLSSPLVAVTLSLTRFLSASGRCPLWGGEKQTSLTEGFQEVLVCKPELKLVVWGGALTGRGCVLPLQGDELSLAPRNKQVRVGGGSCDSLKRT